MCGKCQSNLMEMSLNASKIAGSGSMLNNNNSMDTSTANNFEATNLISQLSKIFDSKLSVLRKGIQEDFKAEMESMKVEIVQNKADIKVCFNEIQLIKKQFSSFQTSNEGIVLSDPHSLLSAEYIITRNAKHRSEK